MKTIRDRLKTDSKSPGKTARPGRPRSSTAHAAVLAAALKLFRQKGYRSVTIEGIAAEAGVGKQTIYRWWPSKAAVVLEAFARYTAGRITMPDTGNFQGDIEAFLMQAFEMLTRESGQLVRSLMSEALLNDEFAVSMRNIFIASRRSALREILNKAIERGEVASDADIEFIIDLIYGPMWYRLLNNHAPLDLKFAEQLSGMIADCMSRTG
ncbi:MAG: TetR/AcrR family transcriptional regulator [Desulfobacterales bacterium]|jgi:AcrR family transcriptional regulator